MVFEQIVCMFRLENRGNLVWTSPRRGVEQASFRTFWMFRRWMQALVPVAIMEIGDSRP